MSLFGDGVETRCKLARGRIDYALPGALEAVTTLLREGSADPRAYETLAERFPARFHRGVRPADDEAYELALAKIRKSGDKAAFSVCSGAEIGFEAPARLSTGCLAVDYVLGGGIPRGYIGQFKGPEGHGKTFVLLKTAAETLWLGGRVLWVPLENFDKMWARRCGVTIPFNASELVDDEHGTREQKLEYNALHPEGSRFTVAVGRNGDELLQVAARAVEANVWDLVAVDSVTLVRRKKNLDERDVGEELMGGEAKLINEWCARTAAMFNAAEQARTKVVGEVLQCKACGRTFGAKDEHPECEGKKSRWTTVRKLGDPVRTAVVVINQLRDRGIGSPFPQRPDAGGGRGLRHIKGYDVEFQTGEVLTATHEGRPVAYGRLTSVEAVKSKVCPPHRSAVFGMWFEDLPGVSRAGEFDALVDLIGCKWKNDARVAGLGEMSGLVRAEPPWYTLGEARFHGLGKFVEYLGDPRNVHILEALRESIRQWIRSGGL